MIQTAENPTDNGFKGIRMALTPWTFVTICYKLLLS